MQYGFIIPGGDVSTIVDLAVEAEAAGWDGFFYWDGICIDGAGPMFDPWATLAAIAVKTNRVKIGAVLTPVSRRRPWKLARETMTVDHLSNGRLILFAGLGALDDHGFTAVGEATDRRTRAELLDEGLEILDGLWSGKPFSYTGKHYQLGEMTFDPAPVQQPRIPIWVAGAWPREKSMQRVARYDGILPEKLNPDGSHGDMAPADITAIRDFVAQRRTLTTPFNIVAEGETPGDDPQQATAIVQPWADAGATWWLETRWGTPQRIEESRARIRQGPPTVAG